MSEVQRLVDEVGRLIDLNSAALGDEFYPAHLSVALADAIFTSRLNYNIQVMPIIDRYCRRFNLCRMRESRDSLPQVDEQETLTDLIAHYDQFGTKGMQEQVFKSRYCSPGTKVLKSENALRAAVALRRIGVDTLQDAVSIHPGEIKCALRPLHGIGDRTIHMFLMYCGTDDFVKGDIHVCRFVAKTLDKKKTSAEEVERLVREVARALGVAARLLDYEIWKLGALPKSC